MYIHNFIELFLSDRLSQRRLCLLGRDGVKCGTLRFGGIYSVSLHGRKIFTFLNFLFTFDLPSSQQIRPL
jgi:hypothetical protein